MQDVDQKLASIDGLDLNWDVDPQYQLTLDCDYL